MWHGPALAAAQIQARLVESAGHMFCLKSCCSVPSRCLLKPLLELHRQREKSGTAQVAASGGSPEQPYVLLLMDALDEADDGGRGWEAVAASIGRE